MLDRNLEIGDSAVTAAARWNSYPCLMFCPIFNFWTSPFSFELFFHFLLYAIIVRVKIGPKWCAQLMRKSVSLSHAMSSIRAPSWKKDMICTKGEGTTGTKYTEQNVERKVRGFVQAMPYMYQDVGLLKSAPQAWVVHFHFTVDYELYYHSLLPKHDFSSSTTTC